LCKLVLRHAENRRDTAHGQFHGRFYLLAASCISAGKGWRWKATSCYQDH